MTNKLCAGEIGHRRILLVGLAVEAEDLCMSHGAGIQFEKEIISVAI